MPSRNLEKIYLEDSYYHLYNRGVDRQLIFRSNDDYSVFLNLLKRHLDTKPVKDMKGRQYLWLFKNLELLAFCLMPNHFHLLVHQAEPTAITQLLRRVATSYTGYFNKKYGRVGPLFQDRFKASLITNDSYLQHISRYIHLNPDDYLHWEFSSLPYYLDKKHAGWVVPKKIIQLFKSTEAYRQFLSDYTDHRKMLKRINAELADTMQ